MTDLQRALANMIGKLIPDGGRIAKVISVDKDKGTCDVHLETDDIDLYGVKLSADGSNSGILIVPKVDTYVVVSTIHNDGNQNYLALVGEVDEIIMRGGSLGGLVKVQDLTDKLNALEKDLNSLKQVFTAWQPVAQDGGAALKAAAATWSGDQITETKKEDLENDKIKHG